MLSKEREKDVEALFEYIFETETDNFHRTIENEDYFVEEGILTESESEEFIEGDQDNRDRLYEISEKAAMNPKCNHIYAITLRLYMDYSLNYRDKK